MENPVRSAGPKHTVLTFLTRHDQSFDVAAMMNSEDGERLDRKEHVDGSDEVSGLGINDNRWLQMQAEEQMCNCGSRKCE